MLSCKDQPKCSADDQGFGGNPTVKIDRLTSESASANNCRARFELIRTQADLDAAYTELNIGGAPTVDFASKVVIARVDQNPASIVWAVSNNGGLVLGLQGCDSPSDGCSVGFYSAPGPFASLDSRTCDPVNCGFSGGN